MYMEVVISVILLLVGITILVIIHICIVGRTFSQDYNNGAIIVQRVMNRRPTMSQDDIKKLSSFDYKVEDQKESGVIPIECAVCLENFMDGEKCRLLPKCNHTFHAQCIDSWLLKTAACPICRAGAVNTPRNREQASDSISEVGAELA